MNNIKEKILNLIDNYPVCEYYFGNTDEIPFSEKTRFICETDCKRYAHSYACPPYCGDVNSCIKKCKNYSHFFLFSTVHEVSDAWNTEACLYVKKDHEALTRDLHSKLIDDKDIHKEDFLVLSTGCTICDLCACPDEPCRHPDERLSSMESHGIVILKLAEQSELCFQYDSTTAVYFSIILF